MTLPGPTVRGNLRFVSVVTARRTSRRLPGKVLQLINGRPMLSYIVERLRSVKRLDAIVIATSTDSSDDPVMAFAESAGLACWRGELSDVLGRVRGAAAAYEADAIVRISGDSPLLDPAIIRNAINRFLDGTADLVTNVFPRSYPKGQSVEILSREALERLDIEAVQPEDREHVTRYAYRHPDRFKIQNFSSPRPRPDLQLSVDTPADLERVTALIGACNNASEFPAVDRLIELADEIVAAQ